MKKYIKIYWLISLALIFMALFLNCRSPEVTSAIIYMSNVDDTEKAIEQLKFALAKDSTNAEAHFLLGVCYGNLEMYFKMNKQFEITQKLTADSREDSMKYADKIMEYRDELWLNNFDYGLDLLDNKMMANAEIAFWNCTNIDSTRPEAYINLAIIEEENDNFEASLKHYEMAFKNNQGDVDLAFYIASLYTKAQKYEKLLDIMNRLLTIEPDNSEALAQRAIAYDYLGENEKAIAAYEEAILVISDDPDLLFNLGRLLFLDGQYEKVTDVLDKVWDLDSTDVQATFLLGSSYLSLGEGELRQLSGKDTVAEVSASDSLLLAHATTLLQNAIYFLKKTAQAQPDNADVWNHLGVAYSYIGEKREADEAFKREKALQKK